MLGVGKMDDESYDILASAVNAEVWTNFMTQRLQRSKSKQPNEKDFEKYISKRSAENDREFKEDSEYSIQG